MEHSDGQAGEGRVKNAILIAGPTASGKSAFALDLAERNGGVIVNTDSMQGYSVLDVLTARPGATDLARAPHFLYGHVHPATAYSTGAWLRDVMRLIDDGTLSTQPDGTLSARPVIFVGGTGLYFRALAEGISEIPEIPQRIRDRWRYELKEQGAVKLHGLLMREDSAAAMTLKPTDSQRIVRALEVLDASGRSILEWQAQRGWPLIDRESARFFVIEPDRAALVHRIEARFDSMLDMGALDEVKRLVALNLNPDLPAMKAIGVRELQAAMAGKIGFPEAIELAKIATRQYAKRQATWFRNQLGPEWQRLRPGDDLETTIRQLVSTTT
jgi:tRNA dimethylallyltransferase